MTGADRTIASVTVEDPTPTPVLPQATGGHPDGPPVGFLELFYDLVFVAATMVISNTFSAELSWRSAGTCAAVFTLLWVMWFHTTLLMNVERRDDLGHRALVLLQMFGISLTVLAFADKEATNNDLLGLSFAAVLLVVAVMYHRAGSIREEVHAWTDERRNLLVFAAVLVGATNWLPNIADDLVYLAALVILLVPSRLLGGVIVRSKVEPPKVDVHHLLERAALLTLIMMGEAFVKVALVVSNGSIERDDIAAMVVEFVAVFALWLVYFDDIPRAGLRRGRTSAEVWTLFHLPLHLGIVGVAIGISKFLQVHDGGVHDEVIVILGVAFVGVYGGLALIGLLGQRRPIWPLTAARLTVVGLSVLFATLTWFVEWFTPFELLLVLAGIEILHAVTAARLRAATTVPAF